MSQHYPQNKQFDLAEGLTVEFKRASEKLPNNFFETVCAFLNLDGGMIILGIEDDGTISGVAPDAIEFIKTQIANLSNNPNKLDPPFLLFPHEEQVNGRWIIKVHIPASSQVHQTDGVVYLRSEDGDYRIKGLHRIAGIMNRKLSFFTEQRVFPHLKLSDLDSDLFARTHKLMQARMPHHPWVELSPEELLKTAGFLRKDFITGEPGYTLASALMFGRDETIQSIVPGYKFDALLRRQDAERYDDRLTIRTNLIDAFDLLMGFIEKHLSDPHYQEGTTSISLRTTIFRELVANIIAHREYTSAAPATLSIFQDRVELKNPNVPHYHGRINPQRFTPFPKNPTICKFMVQLGRYDELGSGVRRVTQYLPHYAPGAGEPVFIDENMFTTLIPLKAATVHASDHVSLYDTEPVSEHVEKLLKVLNTHVLDANHAMQQLGLSHRPTFRTNYLDPALNANLVERTIPDKPQSSKQKYRLTEKGILFLNHMARIVTDQESDQVTAQVTVQVTDQVHKTLTLLVQGESDTASMMRQLHLSHRPTFRQNYLNPALESGLIEMTIPDKPKSSKQKYRLTSKGADFLASK